MQPRRVSLNGSECVRWCPSGLESVRFGGRVSIPTSCHLFQLPLLDPQSTRATGGLNDSLKLFRVYTSLSIINQVNQATCDSDPKHQLLVPFVPLRPTGFVDCRTIGLCLLAFGHPIPARRMMSGKAS